MAEIRIKDNESLGKRFEKIQKAVRPPGVIQEVRKREAYEKPSVKRKRSPKQPASASINKLAGQNQLLRKAGACARFLMKNPPRGRLEKGPSGTTLWKWNRNPLHHHAGGCTCPFNANCHAQKRYGYFARTHPLPGGGGHSARCGQYPGTPRFPVSFDGAVEWTHMVREAGIGIVIVSNNLKKRVAPFAAKFDLPYVTHGLKPLPWGFNKARRMLGNDSKNVLVVGDQIYTDILGANLAKMKSILLEPVEHGESLSIWFRRWLEKPVRRKIRRLQNRGEM